MLDIVTLGGLSICLNGTLVNKIGLRKAEALLVYLAVVDRPVQRSVLASLFWPEHSQTKALTSLRAALAALNKYFGNYLNIAHEIVHISHDLPWRLDSRTLEQHCAAGQVEAALRCFSGDFLEGFHVLDSAAFENWQLSEQARIREILMESLWDALSIAIKTRDYQFGLMLAHKLLEFDEFDEKAHQGCMLLHTLTGDRSAALRHYQQCVEIVADAFSLDPQEETRILYEMISRGENPDPQANAKFHHNLPEATTSFVGRREELFQIKKMLKDPLCRLVTLVGPGGSGKTRLGIEAARLMMIDFPDGIFYVPFDEHCSLEMIVPAIANAMNFAIDTIATRLEPESQLVDFLRWRSVLLILDGFEGLISGGKQLGRMLDHVPGLKMLVTSRDMLDLQCEWPFFVEGLPTGGGENDSLLLAQPESVRLFIDRAAQVNHTFHPSEQDEQSIIRICQLVDGIPLAIELAAAWVGVMLVEDIAKELAGNLDLLSTEREDIPDKHHSIRAVFDSTWEMLSEAQQQLLCKQAIFVSSFDRKAAAEVAQCELNLLSSLVKKALIRCDAFGRFSIHTLIRMFAYERLESSPELMAIIQNKYCRYYLSFLIEHEPDMVGEKMEAARQTLRQEWPHIQKAILYAVQNWEEKDLQKILTSTLVLYAVYTWYEGVDFFRQLADVKVRQLTRENDPLPDFHPIVMICRVYQAFLQTNLGQIEESEEISQLCLQPLHNLDLKAAYSVCLHNLGANASFRGEYALGTELLEQAVLIGRESHFVLWPTYLLWLGHGYLMLGEYEAGLTSLEKSREIFMRDHTLWGAAFAISKMGLVFDGMGEHDKALEYHQEALSVFEKLSNIAGKGYALSRMSMSACFSGKYHLAIRFGQEANQLFEHIGHSWGLASTLPRLGFAYLGVNELDTARELFQRGLNISQKLDMTPMSLYALAGIACTVLPENQNAGINLLGYVVTHDKTPMAFIEKPLSLLESSVQSALTKNIHTRKKENNTISISEMVKWIGQEVNLSQGIQYNGNDDEH